MKYKKYNKFKNQPSTNNLKEVVGMNDWEYAKFLKEGKKVEVKPVDLNKKFNPFKKKKVKTPRTAFWRALNELEPSKEGKKRLKNVKKQQVISLYAAKKGIDISGIPKNKLMGWLITHFQSHDGAVTKYQKFLVSQEWLDLRERVLKRWGRLCMKCGRTSGIIQVDHIKPRSKYPELKLDFNNMQVLCKGCNRSKGITETDYRPIANAVIAEIENKTT